MKTVGTTWTPPNGSGIGNLSSPYSNDTADTQCIDLHHLGLVASIGIDGQCDSISTSWNGLPTPVLTTKIPGETAGQTLRRHHTAMLAAVAANPITPS